MNNWINVKDELPEMGKLVWLFNSVRKSVYLGMRTSTEYGWLWAVSYDAPYVEDDEITADCYTDDDYVVDYWQNVPDVKSLY